MTLLDVLRGQGLDLLAFRPSSGDTPLVRLFGLSLRHAFALSFEHHLTFELGDSSDHIDISLPVGVSYPCRCLDFEFNAHRGQPRLNPDKSP